jgi:hypothetical protein
MLNIPKLTENYVGSRLAINSSLSARGNMVLCCTVRRQEPGDVAEVEELGEEWGEEEAIRFLPITKQQIVGIAE